MRANALLLMVVLLFLAPALLQADGLIYPASGPFSDLTITHWPAFAYLRDALVETGALPLWRTSILGGTPFAADPVSGIWYPPNWLSLVLPLEWFFKLIVGAHLFLGGWAMIRLARSLGVNAIGAMAAGIAYAIAPRVAAHLSVGHITLVEAWPWIPLAVWAVRSRRGFLASGAALGLCALADMRVAVFAGMVVVAYELTHNTQHGTRIAYGVLRVTGTVLIAAVISAAVWLPAVSLSSETTRASLSPSEAGTFSLPPLYLLGTLIATRDNIEYVTFVGLTVLVPALIGGRSAWKTNRRTAVWLIGSTMIGVLLALGSNTPLYEVWYRLPGVSLLRVPARAWIVVAFAAALLCGVGVDALAKWPAQAIGKKWKLASWMIGLLAGLLGAGGAVMAFVGGQANAARMGLSLIGLAIFLPLTIVLVITRANGRLSSNRFGAIVLATMAIELVWTGGLYYRVESKAAAFEDGRAVAEYVCTFSLCTDEGNGYTGIRETGEVFRVYSPSYSVPQHVAQAYGLESVDGINPMQLARTVRFMQRASGVGEWGYSVTLPAFEDSQGGEDVRAVLSSVVPDPVLLGVMNVKYVVAHFPIAHPDLVEEARIEGAIVYENRRALPRAWVVGRVDVVVDQSEAIDWLGSHNPIEEAVVENGEAIHLNVDSHEAQIVSREPDRILVSARGPGLLVLSEVVERDWRASIDGAAATIYPADGVLRGVYLPDGERRVEFVYDPSVVKAGAALSGIGLVGWMVGWIVGRRVGESTDQRVNESVSQ